MTSKNCKDFFGKETNIGLIPANDGTVKSEACCTSLKDIVLDAFQPFRQEIYLKLFTRYLTKYPNMAISFSLLEHDLGTETPRM